GGSRAGSLRTYFNLLVTLTLCGLWQGASWNYVLWGFYNGVLLLIHRFYDRALAGRRWADAVRGSGAFRLLAILVTFFLVAVGLVLVRSESWAGCRQVQLSLAGLNETAAGADRWVPAWAPLLVGMVALGHVFSGLRDRRCGLLDLPPLARAA